MNFEALKREIQYCVASARVMVDGHQPGPRAQRRPQCTKESFCLFLFVCVLDGRVALSERTIIPLFICLDVAYSSFTSDPAERSHRTLQRFTSDPAEGSHQTLQRVPIGPCRWFTSDPAGASARSRTHDLPLAVCEF